MVQINFAQKQISAKVVYYGPGMSGKTTNLEVVHQRAPEQNRGDLTSISTDGDRTLFFDFMPLDLGTVAGMRTCFQIYTVPGQVYYNSTRKLVLQGVDGVVFVADSSAAMMQENLESLRNLEENLNEYGKSLATMPHVIQFNKRDLPDAMSCDELNAHLNTHGAPFFEAIANTGQGVFPTLKALASRVLEAIHAGSAGSGPNTARPAPAQQPRAPMPAPAPAPAPAPILRTSQPPQPVAAFASAPPQRTGFQAPQPSIPMPQQGYQGTPMQSPQQMMQPPQIGMQSMPMQQPMLQQQMPMQQQLVQSGFHQQAQAAPVQQQYAQPAPQQQYAQPAPQQQAQASSLQLQSPRAGGASPSAHSPAPAARGATGPARSGPAPAPKPRPAQSALDGTRFRPRGAPGTPRAEPRATPVAKGGTKLYMAMFITAALVVGAGVTYAIVSFF